VAGALQILHRVFSGCAAWDDVVSIRARHHSIAKNHDLAQRIPRQDDAAKPFPASTIPALGLRSTPAIVIAPVLLLPVYVQMRIAVTTAAPTAAARLATDVTS
jgi:hypothetical protein